MPASTQADGNEKGETKQRGKRKKKGNFHEREAQSKKAKPPVPETGKEGLGRSMPEDGRVCCAHHIKKCKPEKGEVNALSNQWDRAEKKSHQQS